MDASLVKMPDNVLNTILENLDFRSILTLQKVCRDLRHFIDDVIPPSSISEIYLRINTKRISLRIVDPKSLSYDRSTEIKYRNHKKGCSTVKNSGLKKKKQLRGNEDFVDFFWIDFETIMRHQKRILQKFSLVLEHYEYKFEKMQTLGEVSSGILEKLKTLLESRAIPLKVNDIDFGIVDQNEMMPVLPFIDSSTLERISIGNSKGLGSQNLKIDQIVRLEQWKLAKKVEINNDFWVSEPIKSFAKFSKVEISIKTINTATISVLREIFKTCPTMNQFEIYYEPQDQDLRTLFGHRFDGSYDDEDRGARWFFRIPDNEEDVISVQSNLFSWLRLTRVKYSDLPEKRD
ncbi:hypothetical protein GCK72_020468 [Caenorhabditis remanei]|uniref:F-box domain-containing protein n=1 Tax=Caenorhabditis remanei TaxID=31234 RepID=A0A6A5GH24_CAERE|nr:hypothetical protein GCK72_020468 [Caenorhabditis remanei]KAF1753911.1 hypothetical protein GCK72_020468 [Caenorhabditis remanei]